ncbi:MAG: hypothetical protein ACXVEF_16245 [Polyangiales bacterium]
MTLELSADEVVFLKKVLHRHLEEQRRELMHTRDRHLHHDFALEIERLEQLAARVARMLEEPSVHA